MTQFYANVKLEITQFVQREHDLLNSVSTSSNLSSIECLTTISFDTCSHALTTLDLFIQSLQSYISDCSIESSSIVSIVLGSVDLLQILSNHQELFIEYAIDDFLYLDEHFHWIYQKIQFIMDHLENSTNINDEKYRLEKFLHEHLPSTYSRKFSSNSITHRLALTLIDTTSESISTLYNSFVNLDEIEEEQNGILPSNHLFSSLPISSNFNANETKQTEQLKSTIQLDTIDIHTTNVSSQSPRLISFQFDFKDLINIENDLLDSNEWIDVEREFHQNILSIWSWKNLHQMTMNPYSTKTLWPLFHHLKTIESNTKTEYFSVIRWSLALLTMLALNRDWDLLYSRTLINTIVTNRWKTVEYADNYHLSCVGHCLNQLFIRLIRINSVLQYLNVLSDQSSLCSVFFTRMTFSYTNVFLQRIFCTCHLLILWLDQQADAFINSNALERSLVICLSDEQFIKGKFHQLIDALRDVPIDPSTMESLQKKYSSCHTISDEKMSKFYRRVHFNSQIYFQQTLPPTNVGLRTNDQSNSLILVACEKLLNPLLIQLDHLQIDSKCLIYEKIVIGFVEAWTTTLCERKYRFSDEMSNQFYDDYEYFKSFLAKNITDSNIVEHLLQLSCLQQMSSIIHFLRTGEKHPTNPSLPSVSNRDKWIRSSKTPSSFFDYIGNACCCQRRNRVTTGP